MSKRILAHHLRSKRRKKRQGEPNFCSPKQLEDLLSCPEELGTMGILCHWELWKVGLRAPKLNYHAAAASAPLPHPNIHLG